MKNKEVTVTNKDCRQCGYAWEAKVEMPVHCPQCNSKKWNEPTRPFRTCNRCDYKWRGHHGVTPQRCTKCKSPNWNVPKSKMRKRRRGI